MIRISSWIALWLAIVALLPAAAHAQRANPEPREAKQDKNPGEPMIIKVYPVLDLVTRAPDYPYEGSYLPSMSGRSFFSGPSSSGIHYGGGMGGMEGGGLPGMGGGGMGGMGGGMFQVQGGGTATAGATAPAAGRQSHAAAASASGARRAAMQQLIQVISDTVEPMTWGEMGGNGNIMPIGGALAIRQTAAVHAQIKDLLEQLRHESGGVQSLTIGADWLVLSKAQLAGLKAPADPKGPSLVGQSLNRKALDALPDAARRYAGQITCFNGQTVYIISGRLETTIQGGIPVVGGSHPGYQAVLLTPQMGALLQVTASVLSGDTEVLVDLHSSVTRGDQPAKPVILQGGVGHDDGVPAVQIDRLNVAAQQFATSVRMPLGEPVLIGGMTFPGREPGAPDEQLYLILEVEGAK